MPRVGLTRPQIQNVAVATIPVVIIAAVLQAVWIEDFHLVFQASNRVGASKESVFRSAVQAMILRDVARLLFPAARCTGSGFADIFDARDGFAITQGIKRREAVVVHVPAAAVFHL